MIGWAVEALIASAALMLLVLIVRAPVRRHFGPGIAYALWALPAIRLILPPLPQLPSWREAAAPELTARAAETFSVYVIEPLGGSAAAAPSILPQIGLALAGLWAVGAAAFLLWHAVSHWRFCRRMLADSSRGERAGNIEVIETAAASGPLAFGIFRRYVAFPRDFAERYDAEERELALLHELGHHQRGDLIANWVALGVLAAHWFNPLAWRAFGAFRADQEMANDARVLAGRSAIDRHTYACAIVKAAHGGAVSAACHLHTIQDLKGRLKMLTTGRRSRLRLTLGGAAVAALMIGGLAGTASGTTAADTVRSGVEKATGIDFATIDTKIAARLQQTAPPAPPAASEGTDDLPPPPGPPPGADMPMPPKPGVTIIKGPDGKVTKTVVKVMLRDKDGNMRDATADEIGNLPSISNYSVNRVIRVNKDGKQVTDTLSGPPLVTTINCNKDGKGGFSADSIVQNSSRDGKRVMVICKDRIETMTNRAVAEAMKSKDIQRMAYDKALQGLRQARARIAGDASMAGDDKSRALSAIDESIGDLEKDMAQSN